jgi:hypothetical protein
MNGTVIKEDKMARREREGYMDTLFFIKIVVFMSVDF